MQFLSEWYIDAKYSQSDAMMCFIVCSFLRFAEMLKTHEMGEGYDILGSLLLRCYYTLGSLLLCFSYTIGRLVVVVDLCVSNTSAILSPADRFGNFCCYNGSSDVFDLKK